MASVFVGRFGVALGWFAAAVTLASCQQSGEAPSVMSLDEARQETASFDTPAFTPPPRTIADILAVLDAAPPPDAARIAELTAKADAPEPAGVDAIFFNQRAEAAGALGRTQQQIVDFERAVALARVDGGEQAWRYLLDLSVAQVLGGDFAKAVEAREESIRYEAYESVSTRAQLGYYSAILGDIDAAERWLQEAEDVFGRKNAYARRGWGDFYRSRILRTRSRIDLATGKFADSLAALRRSIDFFGSPQVDRGKFKYYDLILENERGNLARRLLRVGRMVEAEVEARWALEHALKRVGRYHVDSALMLQYLIEVMVYRGRFEAAGRLAAAQADIYQRIGSGASSLVAVAWLRQATIQAMRGRWTEALSGFASLARRSKDVFIASKIDGNIDWAMAALMTGEVRLAMRVAEAAVAKRLRLLGDKHYGTAMAIAVRAMVRAKDGDVAAALADFSQAVPILLQRSRQSSHEGSSPAIQQRRLGLVLEAYIALLADVRGTPVEAAAGIDAADVAFRIAEVARGSTVQTAIAASSARAAARDPDLADLARREQDALAQISAIHGLMSNRLAAGFGAGATMNDLRSRVDRLRAARAALTEEIERRFPEYAALVAPKPATLAEARALLRPDEAMVSIYVGREGSFVWALSATGDAAFADVALGREDTDDLVALVRSGLEPNAKTLGDIPAFDLASAYSLYEAFLAPVRSTWGGAKNLLVVPHGPLGTLPFALMPTKATALPAETTPLFAGYRDVPWLARSHAVTVLPSVAALGSLRALPPAAAGRLPVVAFGDPLFSQAQATAAAAEDDGSRGGTVQLAARGASLRLRAGPERNNALAADLARLPRLPETATEVLSIAATLGADLERDIFLRRRASETQVKTMDLTRYRVAVFAMHGLIAGDLDGLDQPALAMSAPAVTGGAEDGLLTMGEIFELRMNADWVVLSACNTAAGAGAGAEAVSGLGRAFFYAGARALLASNWPVESRSTVALTTELFARQAADPGLSRAEALQGAMLSLVDGPGYTDPATGEAVFSYAHPIFWAPFSLIGDGGGGLAS